MAIITGASAGIGRAAAKLFASESAKVIVGARRQAEVDALVAGIVSGDAAASAGDVRSEGYALALEEESKKPAAVARNVHRFDRGAVRAAARPERTDRYVACC